MVTRCDFMLCRLMILGIVFCYAQLGYSQHHPRLRVIKKFSPQVFYLDERISELHDLPEIYQRCQDHTIREDWKKHRTFKNLSFPLALGGSAIIGVQVGHLLSGNRMDVNWLGLGVLLGFGGYISKLASNTHLYRSVDHYNARCSSIQGSLIPDVRTSHHQLFRVSIPFGH